MLRPFVSAKRRRCLRASDGEAPPQYVAIKVESARERVTALLLLLLLLLLHPPFRPTASRGRSPPLSWRQLRTDVRVEDAQGERFEVTARGGVGRDEEGTTAR